MVGCRQAGASVVTVSWDVMPMFCGIWTVAVLDAAIAASTSLSQFYIVSMSVIVISPHTSRPSIPVLQVPYNDCSSVNRITWIF